MSLLAGTECFPRAMWAVWRSAVEHRVYSLQDVYQVLAIDQNKETAVKTVRECFLKLLSLDLLDPKQTSTDQDAFRQLLLGRLMDQNSPEETDFLKALAWWLGLTPYTPYDADAVDRLQRDLPTQQRFIPNSTQWSNFLRWADLLGFTWRTPEGRVVPDPTAALQLVWHGENGVWTLEDWLQQCAVRLPVLQGGRYALMVSGTSNPEIVDLALSLSLRLLESQGLLSLESRSDAPHRRLQFDYGLMPVSHIAWKSGGGQ